MTAQTVTPAQTPPRTSTGDIVKATTMGELIAATDHCRAGEIKGSDQYYAAGDAVYEKIKKTNRWVEKIGKLLAARKLRKLYYEAGAHLEMAAQALSAAIYEEQTILAASRENTKKGFDPTK